MMAEFEVDSQYFSIYNAMMAKIRSNLRHLKIEKRMMAKKLKNVYTPRSIDNQPYYAYNTVKEPY